MTSIEWRQKGGGRHKKVDKAAMKKDSANGSAGLVSFWERKCVRGKINPGLWGRGSAAELEESRIWE